MTAATKKVVVDAAVLIVLPDESADRRELSKISDTRDVLLDGDPAEGNSTKSKDVRSVREVTKE